MMAVQLSIPYETLLALVDQLPQAEKQDLIDHLLANQSVLSKEQRIQLLDAAKLNNPVHEEPSIRRVDWYGDDGR